MSKEIYYQIASKDVPKGFVKEDFWILPKDWKIEKLSNIFEERKEYADDLKKYPLFSLTIESGITKKTERYERKFLVKKEENTYKIVNSYDFAYNPMNIRYGAVALHKHNYPVSLSAYYNTFYVKNDFNPLFMEHFLQSYRMLHFYDKYAEGSLIEKRRLHYSVLLNCAFRFPPVEEQNKIIKILSTWDKAIELKEKLIEEKKKLKKGLMQKLLTGEVRLSGAKGEWKEVKLGSVLKERKETNHIDLELLAITSKNGVVRRSEIDLKDNSSKDKSKYKRICPMDIGYNTMRMWQGVSGLSRYEGIVSPAYTILKPTAEVNSVYMSYLFRLPRVINLFWRNSQGLTNDTLNLKYPNFKGIKVSIPIEIEEQESIVSILQTTDKSIDISIKELELLKQQKKGLMQLLLTGIVRVNTNKPNIE